MVNYVFHTNEIAGAWPMSAGCVLSIIGVPIDASADSTNVKRTFLTTTDVEIGDNHNVLIRLVLVNRVGHRARVFIGF